MDPLVHSILLDLNTNCPYKAQIRLPISPSLPTIPFTHVNSPNKWVDSLCRLIRLSIQQVRYS